ncbi:hypothetical protein, partial [Rhodoblastus sphagnicola]|uniref:hypothetical protein n=1 Tax=Rhodoblastus sphagnicola TaxID=333368 RepID=UPI001AEEE85C
ARAAQIARNTFHLCATFSGGRAFDAAWLATWASVSDRRPNAVVGGWCVVSILFALVQAKKTCSPKRRRLLTAMWGSHNF